MFSSLGTKLALRKAGLSSKDLDFLSPASAPPPKSTKGGAAAAEEEASASGWSAWMSYKALPLTMQPWLSPPPPPVPVSSVPKVGDMAPLDRDRQLTLGGGRKVMVVFLRCVGCAFAQKTFLALRTLANRYNGSLQCIAVSHSSPAATKKWLDLIGGAWNIQMIIDEERAIYSAWGLGVGSVWYVFNPTTQVQGFREKGWLGARVCESIQRTGNLRREQVTANASTGKKGAAAAGGSGSVAGSGTGAGAEPASDGPLTTMGNKWQESGAFAVNGRGVIVWGGKAQRADDVMDLDAGVKALSI